jgi:1-deoxy-D-xylulose 5-phosphate reductoisomerase
VPFGSIPRIIEGVLNRADSAIQAPASLPDVLAIDDWARQVASETIGLLPSS